MNLSFAHKSIQMLDAMEVSVNPIFLTLILLAEELKLIADKKIFSKFLHFWSSAESYQKAFFAVQIDKKKLHPRWRKPTTLNDFW